MRELLDSLTGYSASIQPQVFHVLQYVDDRGESFVSDFVVAKIQVANLI